MTVQPLAVYNRISATKASRKYLTIGDDYTNDSSQVFPYQRIFFFQEFKSGFDYKSFLSSSTSPLKLKKYILYTGRTKAMYFFFVFF